MILAFVEVDNLNKTFSVGRSLILPASNQIEALAGVDLKIRRGEIMGLVGESGCGKSTLARILLHLLPPDRGTVTFDGEKVSELSGRQFRPYRKRIQAVFQNPGEALNPRYKVESSLEEGLVYLTDMDAVERNRRIEAMVDRVGLSRKHLDRYPHQLSGGQRQRVCIARALLVEPELIICDEPTSALDVSIEAQIINLLLDLQQEFDLTYLFISHDLRLVQFFSDRLAVMSEGQIIERGQTEKICNSPATEYTKKLLKAGL